MMGDSVAGSELSRKIAENEISQSISDRIAELEKETSRPGWNLWVLLGGLGTVSLLLINELEHSSTFEFKLSIALLTSMWLVFPIIKTLLANTNSIMCIDKSKFQHVRYLLNTSTRVYVGQILILATIYCLAMVNSIFENQVFRLLFILNAILILCNNILAISVCNKELPIQVDSLVSKTSIVMAIIQYIIPLITCIYLITEIEFSDPLFLQSLKLAGLGFVMQYLLVKSLEVSKEEPLLLALKSLRKELTFNRISNEVAEERLSIITLGFGLKQALRKYIATFLHATKEYAEKSSKLHRMIKVFVDIPRQYIDVKESNIVSEPLAKEIKKEFEELNQIGEKVGKSRKRLVFRLKSFSGKVDMMQDEKQEILDIIENERVHIQDMMEKIRNELASAKLNISIAQPQREPDVSKKNGYK